MAAYAALVSLINILDQIQNHPRLSISLDKKQIESLGDNASFLLDLIESASGQVLENQIAAAAYAAEDVIESHIVDQLCTGPVSLLDLRTVMQDMDSVMESVVNVKAERGLNHPSRSPAFTSSEPLTSTSTGKSKMVGFDEELILLMDALAGRQSSLQVIPIVGMGGIGKTTLAKNVYENSFIVHHFDIRAWATISQQYSVAEIFSQLFSESAAELDEESEYQLTQSLYQSLIGRRYLIVLDDMWSLEVWDKIKFFFPDNNNGSRVVVTTRLSSVANYFGSSYLSMELLDEDRSWKLFCETAFAQTGCCPPELEEMGKKIVRKCRGLPLSIVVIGGLLAKSYKTLEYWESVARDGNSILNSGDDAQSLDILSLSYSHLPAHLKPCFLYMGVFPEDHRIHVTQLVKLWVAEGFIRPNETQRLEEIGEHYLKDLIDRNLISVHRFRSTGKIKICLIHDLLRDLCLKTAENEKFLCVMRVAEIPRDIDKERRIVFHERNSEEENASVSASLTRSLVSNGGRMSFQFRLLRVLLNLVDSKSQDDIFKLFNLRYVRKYYAWKSGTASVRLPSSISLLWNVQTLIIRGRDQFFAPSTIWSMRQLRHVEFPFVRLPEPPPSDDQQDHDVVLSNLQTLKTVVSLTLSEEVCKRLPNVRKMKLVYGDLFRSTYSYCLHNLEQLNKLESLNCFFSGSKLSEEASGLQRGLLRKLTFPSLLLKLSLEGSCLHWEDLSMMGSLPHLQVLKLKKNSVKGSDQWEPVEGEFLRLKFLKIVDCGDLKYWNADSSHFPVLENLFLLGLDKLEEVPFGFGEIPTLRNIFLSGCSESAVVSAVEIGEEQESLGNESLQIRIFAKKKELDKFSSEEVKDKFQIFTSVDREAHFPE